MDTEIQIIYTVGILRSSLIRRYPADVCRCPSSAVIERNGRETFFSVFCNFPPKPSRPAWPTHDFCQVSFDSVNIWDNFSEKNWRTEGYPTPNKEKVTSRPGSVGFSPPPPWGESLRYLSSSAEPPWKREPPRFTRWIINCCFNSKIYQYKII